MLKGLPLVALLLAAPVYADVGFKFVTSTGFVRFAAGDDWPVVTMRPELPVAVAAFQIPDTADEGTPHSTNLAFMFYEHGSDQAAQRLSQVGRQLSASPPQQEVIGFWTVYRQEDTQNGVTYTILDAKTDLSTVAASVMIAWPHLPAHAKSYDEAMEATFRSALASVGEHVGPYIADPNEVIRRRQ